MPADCVLVSIRRGSKVVIPHGGTVLEGGDRVVVFGHPEAEEELERWLGGR